MSLTRYGEDCIPGGQNSGFLGLLTPEPGHNCPGGYSRPGLIGGWTCPCECHQQPAASGGSAAPGSAR